MPCAFCLLFQFLFQIAEQFGMKEFFNGNSQPIAKLFDGGNGSASVASADNIVDSRLGGTTDAAQFIDRKVLLLT